MNKSKIILLSTLAVLSLTACSSKSETESLPEPTTTPVVTMSPQVTSTPQPTSIPDNHDFDNAINTFKDEYAMEHDIDIEEPEILYDWLYNNGVDRISVQNDRDAGCKNPYLDGYLEYLDSLVDKQIAEDNAGQVESSAKGDGLGGTEIIGGDEFILDSDGGGVDQAGVYYTPHQMKGIKQAAEKQEANKAANEALIDQMHKDSQEIAEKANDQQTVQDFLNRLHSGE